MFLAECLNDTAALLACEKNKTLLERNFQNFREYIVTGYIFHPDLLQIQGNFSDAGTTSLNNR